MAYRKIRNRFKEHRRTLKGIMERNNNRAIQYIHGRPERPQLVISAPIQQLPEKPLPCRVRDISPPSSPMPPPPASLIGNQQLPEKKLVPTQSPATGRASTKVTPTQVPLPPPPSSGILRKPKRTPGKGNEKATATMQSPYPRATYPPSAVSSKRTLQTLSSNNGQTGLVSASTQTSFNNYGPSSLPSPTITEYMKSQASSQSELGPIVSRYPSVKVAATSRPRPPSFINRRKNAPPTRTQFQNEKKKKNFVPDFLNPASLFRNIARNGWSQDGGFNQQQIFDEEDVMDENAFLEDNVFKKLYNKNKKKNKKQKTRKQDIGNPMDFQHKAHIGWNQEDGGFNQKIFGEDVMDESVKALLRAAGHDPKTLKPDEVEFVYSFIETYTEPLQRQAVPVIPSSSPISRHVKPPVSTAAVNASRDYNTASISETRRNYPLPQLSPISTTLPTRPPSPPPLPPVIATQRAPVSPENQTAYQAPAPISTTAPPPPPPLPPTTMKSNASTAKEESSLPQKAQGRADLLAQIQAGVKLKSVNSPSEKGPGKVLANGANIRDNVLKEIKQGVSLKRVNQNEVAEIQKSYVPGINMASLAGALALALESRRNRLNVTDSEDTHDDSDWHDG